MKELNQAVYYTTAQVKDEVELSDQNVRKYVRLLEDRNYEVAKDEHNRRLFSQEDITVLKEFIKLAKQPGYTLETAADEIIEMVPNIVSEKAGSTPVNVTNNDINHMLGAVMEKLEAMQQENRELKDNVHRLVERLDEYGRYSRPLSLQYSGEGPADDWKSAEERTDDVSEDYEDVAFTETDQSPSEDSQESSEAGAETGETNEADKEKNSSSVDMSRYEEDGSESNSEEESKATENSGQNNEEKGGYFSRLFSMFKK